MRKISILLVFLLGLAGGCATSRKNETITRTNITSWAKHRNTSQLIKALGDRDPDIRQSAATALGMLGNAEVADALASTLKKDQDPGVRRAAVKALGNINDDWTKGSLVSALQDKEETVRNAAAWVLDRIDWQPRDNRERAWFLIAALKWGQVVKLGEPAITPLLSVLRDNNSYVRRAAAWTLDGIGWQPEEEVNRAWFLIAARRWDALSRLGKPVVEPLLVVLNDKEAGVRKAAAATLGKIGVLRAVVPLIATLKDKDPTVRYAVVQALGEIGEPGAIKPLIEALEDKYQPVRQSAAKTLGEIGDSRAIKPLVKALTDKNTVVRKTAAGSLDNFHWQPRDEEEKARFLIACQKWNEVRKLGLSAAGELVNTLKDEDRRVRYTVAAILEKIGWQPEDNTEMAFFLIAAQKWDEVRKLGAPAVKPLIIVLRDEDPNIREIAAETLGKIGDARAVKPLIAALKNRDSLKILGAKGRRDSAEMLVLLAALRDKKPSVRHAAAKALGGIGSLRVVEPLITALRDEHQWVRGAAAEALGKIGDSRAVRPLLATLKDPSALVRTTVAWALDMTNSQWKKSEEAKSIVPSFIAALQHEYPEEREGAAEALGRLGDGRAVRPLVSILRDEGSGVRKAAAWALGRIGDIRAAKPLSALLLDRDEFVRREVASALRKLGYTR